MKTLKITIERSQDGYTAYAENATGIYGQGDSVSDAKASIGESIRLTKEYNDPKNWPDAIKGKYTLIYKMDVNSLLDYYKGIFTNSALERLTGINQKLLQHYASGLKRPRPAQAKKIEAALHKLGGELLAVEL